MSWQAGELPEAVTAEEVGLCSQRLANINPYLQQYVDDQKIAGCSIAVMRKGKMAFFNTYGHSRTDEDQPMARDTIHRIYSMSKPITSVALLTLFEKGRFQLDDPIEWYLPEYKNMKVMTGGTANLAICTKPSIKKYFLPKLRCRQQVSNRIALIKR